MTDVHTNEGSTPSPGNRVSDEYLRLTLSEISHAKSLDSQMISTAFLRMLLNEIVERRADAEPHRSPEPEVIPDATRKLGELASARILLRTALSQITVQRLRGRKTSAGLIAEDALEKTASAGHLAMALGSAPPSADLERYKQALQRANGFLMMNDLEPVKLEYGTPEPLCEQAETCEWSEIEEGSGIYNTCQEGEEFHLHQGMELWPYCHLCGRKIAVADPAKNGDAP